jgi:hypothetical protein
VLSRAAICWAVSSALFVGCSMSPNAVGTRGARSRQQVAALHQRRLQVIVETKIVFGGGAFEGGRRMNSDLVLVLGIVLLVFGAAGVLASLLFLV